MPYPKRISILGVTGSIGQSTADVVASAPDRFDVQVVTGHSNAALLAETALRLKAKTAIIGQETQYHTLKDLLAGSGIEVRAGRDAIIHAVDAPLDVCVSAITGMAGLMPLMQALSHAACVAIANKEPLVAAGRLVMECAKTYGCTILPIDSEHNAVFQVFDTANKSAIERIILTASGGPFRSWSKAEMAQALPAQALAHPTWSMGRKISIDSATMMNKALEVIEAHVLFDLPAEQIDVLIHPQSIIHSMVEYADGSVLAQMGASDMRTPIAHCLAWPARMKTPGQRLDFTALKTLAFEPPDEMRFPALRLAYACLARADEGQILAFNAANEIAVEAFLNGGLSFTGIVETVEDVAFNFAGGKIQDIDAAIEMDRLARIAAKDYIARAAAA